MPQLSTAKTDFQRKTRRVRWIADSTGTENHKQVSAEKVQESCRVSAQLETGTPNLPGNAFFPSLSAGRAKIYADGTQRLQFPILKAAFV